VSSVSVKVSYVLVNLARARCHVSYADIKNCDQLLLLEDIKVFMYLILLLENLCILQLPTKCT
jgi:hypothetical protein